MLPYAPPPQVLPIQHEKIVSSVARNPLWVPPQLTSRDLSVVGCVGNVLPLSLGKVVLAKSLAGAAHAREYRAEWYPQHVGRFLVGKFADNDH